MATKQYYSLIIIIIIIITRVQWKTPDGSKIT